MDNAEFLLGTVTAVSTSAGIKIQLDGQDAAMSKYYKILITGAEVPVIGERVAVMKHSGTYVVIGKIGMPSDNTGKVNRSGDTMTGNLTLDSVYISHKSQDVNLTVHPEEAKIKVLAILRDVASRFFGRIYGAHYTNGRAGIGIGAVRDVNGSNVYNAVELLIDDSGNRSVAMHDPQAWRSALNALNKAGDTMTGDLILDNVGIGQNLKTINLDVHPTETLARLLAILKDVASNSIGRIMGLQYTNGRAGIGIGAVRAINGSNVFNELYLLIDDSGNRYVTIAEQKPWRSALGLGTNGDLPITIAQGGTGATSAAAARNNLGLGNTTGALPIANGGTGQTGTTITTTVSDIFSSIASGITVSSASYVQFGKVAMFTAIFTPSAAGTTFDWTTWATLKAGKRPASIIAVHCQATTYCLVGTNGDIQFSLKQSANVGYRVSAIYLLP